MTIKTIITLLVAALASACGGDVDPKGDATPLEAAIVILAEQPDTDTGSVQQIPVCGGVAVGEHEILTVEHCLPTRPVIFADVHTFTRTSHGFSLATVSSVAGSLASLRTAEPLRAWVARAAAADGLSALVRLRSIGIRSDPVEIVGDRVETPLEHGDSGSGVFQGGRVVGLIETCDDPDLDDVCEPTGGRFIAPF